MYIYTERPTPEEKHRGEEGQAVKLAKIDMVLVGRPVLRTFPLSGGQRLASVSSACNVAVRERGDGIARKKFVPSPRSHFPRKTTTLASLRAKEPAGRVGL